MSRPSLQLDRTMLNAAHLILSFIFLPRKQLPFINILSCPRREASAEKDVEKYPHPMSDYLRSFATNCYHWAVSAATFQPSDWRVRRRSNRYGNFTYANVMYRSPAEQFLSRSHPSLRNSNQAVIRTGRH